MMIRITDPKDLPYLALMEIYASFISEKGKAEYPQYPENIQILNAEQDLYDYLRNVHLCQLKASVCFWRCGEELVSVLRLEAYNDGLLLSGLETAPGHRQKGYGKLLLQQACRDADEGCLPIYSHVFSNNTVSMKLHLDCGFVVVEERAVLLDGSIHHDAVTLRYTPKEWTSCLA